MYTVIVQHAAKMSAVNTETFKVILAVEDIMKLRLLYMGLKERIEIEITVLKYAETIVENVVQEKKY